MAEKSSSAGGREIWLDGLRGVAALIVAWFHLTTGMIDTPYRSFWDSPASENRHFIQIAPFRVIFAGQAMVDIFFVVSGYSISVGLIKLRNEGALADFYRKLTSSVVRRVFRLWFPVAVVMLAAHVLFYMGFYATIMPEGQGCSGTKPWGSPIPHIQCLIRSTVGMINVQADQDRTLNNHFWTIPMEIIGSFKVYLALLGLSTVSETVRLAVIALLAIRGVWNAQPEALAFFAGNLFAELDASAALKSYDLRLPSPLTAAWDSSKLTISQTAINRIKAFFQYYLLAIGIYLICLPAPRWTIEGQTSPTWQPEWSFFRNLLPFPWFDWAVEMRTWHTIGAVIVVNSLRVLPVLRAPFETKFAQFLGVISFSLYLCHQAVYRILVIRLLNWTSMAMGYKDFWDAKWAGNSNMPIIVSWAVTISVVGTLLMLISKYMARAVDQRSVGFGHYMEKLLTQL